MFELITSLKDANIPAFLVVVGVFMIIFALGAKAKGAFEFAPTNRRLTGAVGTLLSIAIVNGGGNDTNGLPYTTNVLLKNPERWSVAVVKIDSIGGPTRIEMVGYFDAERISPIVSHRDLTSPHITWSGGFTAFVVNDPNRRIRGLPGLILRKAEPVVGGITEWRYQHGKTYAADLYVAV